MIRVLLPDAPGSLGQLADAFGLVDGNIQSVDIVENFPDGTVMDDIVIELPQGAMADVLITAASSVDGVEIDSIRPFSGRVDRRGQIELLARVANATNVTAAMEEVVAAIPKAARRELTTDDVTVVEESMLKRAVSAAALPVPLAGALRDVRKYLREGVR